METFPKSGIKSKKRKAVSEGETTTAVAAKKNTEINHSLLSSVKQDLF